MARTEYWLSSIRGLLGLLGAIELLIVAYLIQINLQTLYASPAAIPTTFLPILNALQITVALAVAAAALLIAGLVVRLRASDEEEEEEGSE